MEDRYKKLLSEFSQEDRLLLRRYLHELFEYKDKEDFEKQTRAKLKETLAEIKIFEERAKSKIEQRKKNPTCSFCKQKSDVVEKMFNHTDYLNICSDCVKRCYEQL